jgi:hypothetical protein
MTFFRNITVAWNETCPYVDDVVSFVDCYQRNVPTAYFLTKEPSLRCHYRHIIFQSKSSDSSDKWKVVVGFMAVWHSWQWQWNCSHHHCVQNGSQYSLCTNKNQNPTVSGKAVAAWHWSVACTQYEGPEILRFSQHCIEHSTVLGCGAVSVSDKIHEQYNHV